MLLGPRLRQDYGSLVQWDPVAIEGRFHAVCDKATRALQTRPGPFSIWGPV